MHSLFTSADDVENGICLHDEDNELQLMRITKIELLEANSLLDSCSRCQESDHFEAEERSNEPVCVCTPQCGSCDSNPTYRDDESGYMCINLSAYVKAKESGGAEVKATLIPNTGGMQQGRPYGGSAECSFGRTYRTHKRGTKYDAAVANLPNDSIVIIDMDKMEKKCTVDLPAKPSKVLYAPDQPVNIDALMSSKTGGDSSSAANSSNSMMTMTTILGPMAGAMAALFV